RDHAELDLPADETRRDDQGGYDLNQVIVTRREKAQVSIHRGDPPKVFHQLVDAVQQPRPPDRCAKKVTLIGSSNRPGHRRIGPNEASAAGDRPRGGTPGPTPPGPGTPGWPSPRP